MSDPTDYLRPVDENKTRIRKACKQTGEREVRIKILPGGEWSGYEATEATKWLLGEEEKREKRSRWLVHIGTWSAVLAAIFSLIQLFR